MPAISVVVFPKFERCLLKMRVIAGKLKGSKIESPGSDYIRPTADKVKEAIFSIIQTEVPGSVFLDLFGGSGGIGIEAASRGAKSVTFVDSSRESYNLIRSNAERLKIDAEIIYKDSIAAIKMFGADSRKFDIIYIDPPYNSALDKQAVEAIAKFDILSENGTVIVEHKAKKDLQISKDSYIIRNTKKYGTVYLTFLSLAKTAKAGQ